MQLLGMERWLILVVLLLTAHVRSLVKELENNTRESILSRAIVQIVFDVQKRQLTTLHFIQYETNHIDDIISGAVNRIRTSHAYTIEDIDHISELYIRWFNIVLINGYKELSSLVKKLNETYFDPRGYYIIVVEPALSKKGRENFSTTILKSFSALFYDNVIVLFRDESASTVFMYAFLPCDRSHACYEVVPVLYNTFEGEQFHKKKWHFPKKWKDFNQCPISVAFNHFPPHILLTETEQGLTNVEGVDNKILSMIAFHLNFKIDYEISNRGCIYNNRTATGVFDMILNGKADLIIGGFAQTEERDDYLSASVPYFQTELVYALQASLEFGSLERHLFPFRKEIWIAYFSIHCGAFIFLLILRRFGSKVYNFIVGDHTRSPFLDMFQMFFGVSIPRTPRYTFARTFFGIWLLSTFIISTTYRGRLIEMLTSKSSKSIPRTIKEFNGMNYEINVRSQLQSYMMSIHGNDTRIKVTEQIWDYFPKLQIPSGHRHAVADTDMLVNFFNAYHYRNGVLPILPERLQHVNLVILFKKNSYFVPPFNRILRQFASSGLIDKWTRDVLNISSVKSLRTSGPKKLDLSHFEGTFELYGMIIGIAVLMFAIELISLKWNMLRKIMQEHWVKE